MTNLEAIREDLYPYPVRTSQIERQCVKHGIDPEGYAADEKTVSICAVEILSQMIALSGVSEGGVSFSFDTEKAKALIKRKCVEAGLDYSLYVTTPIVTRLE